MIFFGAGPAGSVDNITWVLSNANGLGETPTWTQLATVGTAPPIRNSHTAVYDAASNRMTLFGGNGYVNNVLTEFNDVWVLSSANGLGGTPAWTQLAPAGALPPSRVLAAAVYDPATNRMVIFGGTSSLLGTYYGDTWVLTNANGIEATPPVISGLPSAGCVLWPPNHKLVQVATVTASDTLGLASFNVTAISNEPSDSDEPEVIITGSDLEPRIVQLRAERLGSGTGRVYTITANATSVAGLSATSTATCTVPHDQGGK